MGGVTMKKAKWYHRTKFSAKVVAQAHEVFLSKLDAKNDPGTPSTLQISYRSETWDYDSLQEFLAEYPKAEDYVLHHAAHRSKLWIYAEENDVLIEVRSPVRADIEAVFQVFEENAAGSAIPIEPVRVFVGHGHDSQWRDLKDHLSDRHGVEVVAYEIGSRAGRSVKEVLESMLSESSIALLVMTGEDLDAKGALHARENVVHELGLFQGRLGFERAIALVEEGVEEFSNISGLNQIRFSEGNIREAFGDVLALIRREFPQQS